MYVQDARRCPCGLRCGAPVGPCAARRRRYRRSIIKSCGAVSCDFRLAGQAVTPYACRKDPHAPRTHRSPCCRIPAPPPRTTAGGGRDSLTANAEAAHCSHHIWDGWRRPIAVPRSHSSVEASHAHTAAAATQPRSAARRAERHSLQLLGERELRARQVGEIDDGEHVLHLGVEHLAERLRGEARGGCDELLQ